VEDGYTRIANELLEQVMAAPLTLREIRVVMAVVRLTYGWNRKQARVTGGLLAKLTGIHASHVAKVLAGLIEKNVVIRHGGSRSPVSLNKHADQWHLDDQKYTPPLSNTIQPDSSQIGLSDSSQIGFPSKDIKDITTAEAVVNVQNLRDAFEIFYNAGLPKKNRKVAEAKFKKTAKRLNRDPVEFAEFLASDIGKRLTAEQQGFEMLHPATYLNNERWIDDIEERKTPAPTNPNIPGCPHADLLAIWDDTCGKVKGKAPNLLDWQGTKSADALAERWAEFYGVEVNGRVRYGSLEAGLEWWRMALETIAAKQDFRSADADIWSLFYKGRFGRAANGNLCSQGGATR
jgi:phage replication O-like protein O